MEASKTTKRVSMMMRFRRTVRMLQRFCALFLAVVLCTSQAGTQEMGAATRSVVKKGSWQAGWRSNATAPVRRDDAELMNHAALKAADSLPYGAEEPLFVDADKDGIDDAWEMLYFGKLTVAGKEGSGDMIKDRIPGRDFAFGYTDSDGDGLNDLNEFLAGTNPLDAGGDDGNADSDGDGLNNYEEQEYGTNPGKDDTDGDGKKDIDELDLVGGDPLNPFKPYQPGYLKIASKGKGAVWGTSRELTGRDALKNFTVEFWFRMTSENTLTGRLLTKQTEDGRLDEFRLYVQDGRFHFAVASSSNSLPATKKDAELTNRHQAGLDNFEIPRNVWVHVSASVKSYTDHNGYQLTLRAFAEGMEYEKITEFLSKKITTSCSEGSMIIGGAENPDMTFDMDELRLWNVSRTAEETAAFRSVPLVQKPEGLVLALTMDDGARGGRNNVAADIIRGDKLVWDEGGTGNDTTRFYEGSEDRNLREAMLVLNGDSDKDGLYDAWELRYFGNLNQTAEADYDNDGLTNLEEFRTYGMEDTITLTEDWVNEPTDPAKKYTYNPTHDLQKDSDGDDLTNEQELRQYFTHAGLADTDDDTLKDNDPEEKGLRGEQYALNPFRPYRPKFLNLQADGKIQMANFKELKSIRNFTVEFWLKFNTVGSPLAVKLTNPKEENFDPFQLEIKDSKTITVKLARTDRQIEEVSFSRSTGLWKADWQHVSVSVSSADERSFTVQLIVWNKDGAVFFEPKTKMGTLIGSVSEGVLEISSSIETLASQPLSLDEFRIWNGSRTAKQIDAFRHVAEIASNTVNLAANLRFDDGGKTAQNDVAGSSLTARLVKATMDPNYTGPGAIGDPARDWLDYLAADTDEDGITDAWELWYFGNLDTADENSDYDEDGLTDRFESHAGLDPTTKKTGTGTDDADDSEADPDRDGLNNLAEMFWGTDPGNPDTDDDGINDGAEVNAESSPLFSMNENTVNSCLKLQKAGTTGLNIPMTAGEQQMKMPSWTVEAWIKTASDATGVIVRRTVRESMDKDPMIGFELGLSGGVPYIKYDRELKFNTSIDPKYYELKFADANKITAGSWNHLAASWNSNERMLTLVWNGVSVKQHQFGMNEQDIFPVEGFSEFTMAGPAHGWGPNDRLDEVRIWRTARSIREIDENKNQLVQGNEPGLFRLFRFDDKGNSIEDFAHPGPKNFARYAIAMGDEEWVDVNPGLEIKGFEDADQDGLPDWYESFHRIDNAQADADNDGLSNLYEYLCGTEPVYSTDKRDFFADAAGDETGKKLTNGEKQLYGLDPREKDTDGDGVSDYDEVKGTAENFAAPSKDCFASNPLNPLENGIPALKTLNLNGTGITIPSQARHALESWTIMANVKPTELSGNIALINRTAKPGVSNYYLGWDCNEKKIKASFIKDGTDSDEVKAEIGFAEIGFAADKWFHLAASYDAESSVLRLYVNGMPVAENRNEKLPYKCSLWSEKAPELVIGQGLKGQLDNVRIYGSALPGDQIWREHRSSISAVMAAAEPFAEPKQGYLINEMALEDLLDEEKPRIPDQILVKFRSDLTVEEIKTACDIVGAKLIGSLDSIGVKVLQLQESQVGGCGLSAAVSEYRSMTDFVDYVEPHYAMKLSDLPNDPEFVMDQMWGLKNTGNTVEPRSEHGWPPIKGVVGADMNVVPLWNKGGIGSDEVVVAVIDTGVDYNHEDLKANMWKNPGEISGNGIDDDMNGYVDDVYGYNFTGRNGNPMDVMGHGTHCAGTIGAVGGNGIGVIGVNQKVKIMALRVADEDGNLPVADIVDALDYAVKMGAVVSNHSYGGYMYSETQYQAFLRAQNAGHLTVVAAGNETLDNDGVYRSYPASFDLDNIISVAALAPNDTMASFSNYGATSVDVAAPGYNIVSTVPGDEYDVYSGTSMATPHVVGLAALLKSKHMGASYFDLKNAIVGGCVPVPAFAGKVVSGGRVNAVNSNELLKSVQMILCLRGNGLLDGKLLDLSRSGNDQGKPIDFGTASPEPVSDAELAMFCGDSDMDGIPDWYEVAVGLNPYYMDGREDADGDGLTNYFEYLAGSSPWNQLSNRVTADAHRTLKNYDTITWLEAQRYGLKPDMDADTDWDDDGEKDISEKLTASQPLLPYKARSLYFSGSYAGLELPNQPRFALTKSWSIDAWVLLDEGLTADKASVLSRTIGEKVNYELAVKKNGSAYHAFVRYTDEKGVPVELESLHEVKKGIWTHIGAVYDNEKAELSIAVNNGVFKTMSTGGIKNCGAMAGVSKVMVGSAEFKGNIDSVRIWNIAKADFNDNNDSMVVTRPATAGLPAGLVANYTFDDGGETAQDFASALDDWNHGWMNASVKGATFSSDGSPVNQKELDSDGDGIPDWWELLYGFNPNDPSDALADLDGDGLNNLYEYLAGTDPRRKDSNSNGISDGSEDTDGDGLTNAEEQYWGTHPKKTDTDDDGIGDVSRNDYEEVMAGASPIHPMSQLNDSRKPVIAPPMSLDMAKVAGRIRLPGVSRFAVGCGALLDNKEIEEALKDTRGDFTIEAYVKLGKTGSTDDIPANMTGVIFGYTGTTGARYELGIAKGVPYGKVYKENGELAVLAGGNGNTPERGSEGTPTAADNTPVLETGKWVHLALTWESQTMALTLYRDRLAIMSKNAVQQVDFGEAPGVYTFAEGFTSGIRTALLDEFRFWRCCRPADQIDRYAREIIPAPFNFRNNVMSKFNLEGLNMDLYAPAVYYRFDDGGKTIEDFAQFADESYALNAERAEDGVKLRGMDDVNGDRVPEWWAQYYHLDDGGIVSYGPLSVYQNYSSSLQYVYYQRYFFLDEKPAGAHHVKWTYSQGCGVTLYVNGVMISSTAADKDKESKSVRADGDKEDKPAVDPLQTALRLGRNSVMIMLTRKETEVDKIKIYSGYLSDFELSVDDKVLIPSCTDRAFDPAHTFAVDFKSIDRNFEGGPLLSDADGDDVPVEWEYQLNMHPLNSSSFNDGIKDGNRDMDKDGLRTAYELQNHLVPSLADTDNDGISDGTEIAQNTDPLNFNSPVKFRSIKFSKEKDLVVLPARADLSLRQLTFEMWLKPGDANQNGLLLKRVVGTESKEVQNYGIRLVNNKVEFFFTDDQGEEIKAESTDALQPGVWSHLAVTLDEHGLCTIYFNGVENAVYGCNKQPALTGSGEVFTILGGKLTDGKFCTNLQMDEVRIWKIIRTAAELAENSKEFLQGSEKGLVAYYRFDDCDKTGRKDNNLLAADSAHPFDWNTGWFNAAKLANADMVYEDQKDNPIVGDKDSDGDGMPDWWEDQYGLNKNDEKDALLDKDGDQLTNLYEYLAGTNPGIASTDGSHNDAQADSDQDGIINITEQALGTHPGVQDTDDDGKADGEEYLGKIYKRENGKIKLDSSNQPEPADDQTGAAFSDPASSSSPRRSFCLEFAANGTVIWPAVRKNEVLDLKDAFTIEFMFKAGAAAEELVLLSRESETRGVYSYRLLRNKNGRLVFTVGASSMTLTEEVPADEWVYVTAVYDKGMMTLTMTRTDESGLSYSQTERTENGMVASSAKTSLILGAENNTAAFFMDELRIWNTARSNEDLVLYRDAVLAPMIKDLPNLVLLATADDNGVTVENMAARTSYNGKVQVPDLNVAGQMKNVDFGKGYSKSVLIDSDGDKIADWWEMFYFGDLKTADDTTDYDGDGLLDITEWLTSATDKPMNPTTGSTDGKTHDTQVDSDDDGIGNLAEQNAMTHPGEKDTDDDGFVDGYELGYADRNGKTENATGMMLSSPLKSLEQPNAKGDGKAGIYEMARTFRMTGANRMTVANNAAHSGSNLTVGFWFRYNTHNSVEVTLDPVPAPNSPYAPIAGSYTAGTPGADAKYWAHNSGSGYSIQKDALNQWVIVSDNQKILASSPSLTGNYEVLLDSASGVRGIMVADKPNDGNNMTLSTGGVNVTEAGIGELNGSYKKVADTGAFAGYKWLSTSCNAVVECNDGIWQLIYNGKKVAEASFAENEDDFNSMTWNSTQEVTMAGLQEKNGLFQIIEIKSAGEELNGFYNLVENTDLPREERIGTRLVWKNSANGASLAWSRNVWTLRTADGTEAACTRDNAVMDPSGADWAGTGLLGKVTAEGKNLRIADNTIVEEQNVSGLYILAESTLVGTEKIWIRNDGDFEISWSGRGWTLKMARSGFLMASAVPVPGIDRPCETAWAWSMKAPKISLWQEYGKNRDIVFLKRTVSDSRLGADNVNYAFHYLDGGKDQGNLALEVTSGGQNVRMETVNAGLKENTLYFIAGTVDAQESGQTKVILTYVCESGLYPGMAENHRVARTLKNGVSTGDKGLFVIGSEKGWRDGLVLDVDDVSVWNRVLQAVEMEEIYSGSVNVGSDLQQALVSCFNFDDGGETAEDSVSQQNWLDNWSLAGVMKPAVKMVNGVIPEYPYGMVRDSTLADRNNDRDHDGLPDDWELDHFGDLEQKPEDDFDGDGLNNRDEYAHGTDPANNDTDEDGMPDGWEIRYAFDPLDPADASQDKDQDGLANAKECQLGTDPLNEDSDGDGMPDGWESKEGLNPLIGDNHPEDTVNGSTDDPDKDGIDNLTEFYYGTKPLEFNNLKNDSDHDGLTDQEEIAGGTDMHLTDTDDDEFSDDEESTIGTKGNDSTSKPGKYDIMNNERGFDYAGNLVARFDGKSGPLTIPAAGNDRRLAFGNWTIEARFRVQKINYFGTLDGRYVYLIRRSLSDNGSVPAGKSVDNVRVSNYYLGYQYHVENNAMYLLPVAGYQLEINGRMIHRRVMGELIPTSKIEVEASTADAYYSSRWTFLSASFDASTQELKIYQNGNLINTLAVKDFCEVENPRYPYAYVKLGEDMVDDCRDHRGNNISLELNLDEVRIWGVPANKVRTRGGSFLKNVVRSSAEILAGARMPVMPRLGVFDSGLDYRYATTSISGEVLAPENRQTYAIDRRVDDNAGKSALNDGQTGIPVMVTYNDANDNKRWDPGEDVWYDQDDPAGTTTTVAGVYENKFDIRLARGYNGWTTPDASAKKEESGSGGSKEEDKKPAVNGRSLLVYYHDIDKDQKISENDLIWVDYLNDKVTDDMNQFQSGPQLWAEAMGLALYLRFDDGGMSMEDYAWRNDWKSTPRWSHAIIPENLQDDQRVTDEYAAGKAWVCDIYQAPQNLTVGIRTLFNRKDASGTDIAVINYATALKTDILTAVAGAVDPEGGEVSYSYYWLVSPGQDSFSEKTLVVENGELVNMQAEGGRIPAERILGRDRELDLYTIIRRLANGDTIQLAVFATNTVGKNSRVKVKPITVVADAEISTLPPVINAQNGFVYDQNSRTLILNLEANINDESEIHVDWFRNLEFFRSAVQTGRQCTEVVTDNSGAVVLRKFRFVITDADILEGDVWSFKVHIVYKEGSRIVGTSRTIPPERNQVAENRKNRQNNEWWFQLIGEGYNIDKEHELIRASTPPVPVTVSIEPLYPDVNSVLIAHPKVAPGAVHPKGYQYSYYYEWYVSKGGSGSSSSGSGSGSSSDKDDTSKPDPSLKPGADGFMLAQGQTGQSWRNSEFELFIPGMIKTQEQIEQEQAQAEADKNKENGSSGGGTDDKDKDTGSIYNDRVVRINGRLAANDRIYVKVYTMDIYGNRSEVCRSNIVTVAPDPKESSSDTSISFAYEVNNTFAEARQILPKTDWLDMDDENVQVHYFGRKDDRDFVWFIVPQNLSGNPSLVTFETNASSENGGTMFDPNHVGAFEPGPDTMAQLFDSNYKRLLVVNDIGYVQEGYRGGTRFARFEKVLEPGIYYVMVTNADWKSWAMEAPYAMHLKIEETGGVSGPSSAQVVNLMPDNPSTTDDLKCWASGATAESGHVVNYKYIWFRNHEIVPFNGNSTDIQPWEIERYELNAAKQDKEGEPANVVPASYTKPNEIWYCKVYSYINDNGVLRYGKPVYSKAVKIQGSTWNTVFHVTKKFKGAQKDVVQGEQSIEIGWEIKGTHGYDPSYDIAMQGFTVPSDSDIPYPIAAGRSYSVGMDNDNGLLIRDIRPYGRAASWFIRIDMGDPKIDTIRECRLSWPASVMPSNSMNGLRLIQMRRAVNGSFEVQPNGIMTQVEEFQSGEIVLDEKALSSLQKDEFGQRYAIFAVVIGAPDVKDSIALSRTGWQLISFPVTPLNNLTEEVLVYNGRPVYNGKVWTYENGQNVIANRIVAGVGYWLNIVENLDPGMAQNMKIYVTGSKPSVIALKKGWNMFGPVEEITDFKTMYSDNDGKDFLSKIRKTGNDLDIYSVDGNGQYIPVKTGETYPLTKGKGYWIYLNEDMELPVRAEKIPHPASAMP